MHTTRAILKALTSGKLTVEEAEKKLQILTLNQVEKLAVLNHRRQNRIGIPEVVMARTSIRFSEAELTEMGRAILNFSVSQHPA
jgi:NCAIR mutase (PurE)-related protein